MINKLNLATFLISTPIICFLLAINGYNPLYFSIPYGFIFPLIFPIINSQEK